VAGLFDDLSLIEAQTSVINSRIADHRENLKLNPDLEALHSTLSTQLLALELAHKSADLKVHKKQA